MLHMRVIWEMSQRMTKPTKWHVRPVKTQISLPIRSVWSESSLSAWKTLWSLATHWAHSEYSDQTGRIWVFAERTCHFVVFVMRWLRVIRCGVRKLGSFATHWAHSEDSDQTGRRMLVLSCTGSNNTLWHERKTEISLLMYTVWLKLLWHWSDAAFRSVWLNA